MKNFTKTLPVVSSLTFVSLFACGGGGDGGSSTPPIPIAQKTTVEFVYLANTELDPALIISQPNCVELVGHTHIHPSWQNFELVSLPAFPPSEFRISFSNVPVGFNRIRISDRNACAINATGASIQNVFANSVLLTNVVDTPGTGIEPGLSFNVTAGGVVTP